MDDIIKGLCLIVAWYNSRLDLVGDNTFTTDDFQIIEYTADSVGNWSLRAIHKNIADHYFTAVYDLEDAATVVAQFQTVASEHISDEGLVESEEAVATAG